MKFLIQTTEIFRCDSEQEAETFLKDMKKDKNYEITSSTVAKKEVKQKGEVVDSYIKLTVKKVYNEEKDPLVPYNHKNDDDEEEVKVDSYEY